MRREELPRYYSEAMKAHRPLTRSEEHALAVRARAGDVSARKRLVEHNLAMVLAVVLGMKRGAIPLDDLIQEGNEGLMHAAEKFDPHAGTKFVTYAVWWIRAYVSRYLQRARSSVKPRTRDVAQHDLSLDARIGELDDTTFMDTLIDESPGPQEMSERQEVVRQVRAVLGRLRDRVGPVAWDIIRMRCADDAAPQSEVARLHGVSRQWVSITENKTRRLLRQQLAAEMNRGPLPTKVRPANQQARAKRSRKRSQPMPCCGSYSWSRHKSGCLGAAAPKAA